MANFFSGNFFRRVFRFIALLVALVAGILFANAITIFQEPENRLRNGDTAPSVEPDAFPLVIVGICIFWNGLVLVADIVRKKPIRPKISRFPDAALWMSLIASASTTIYLSEPFGAFSSSDFNRAGKIKGWAIIMTYAASGPHFIVLCFTLRDAIVAKHEKNAKKTADMEAANDIEHVECRKCKNVELPPAYEHVEIEETLPVEQTMTSKTEQGPIAGTLPLQPNQSGLSAVDDEGRVLGA